MGESHHLVVRRVPEQAAAGPSDGRVTIAVGDVQDIEAVIATAKSGALVLAVVDDDESLVETVAAELRRIGPAVRLHDGQPPPARDQRLDEECQEVLDLLAEGLTVSQAARRLGVSARTATRRIETSRRLLGVATTAEAVVASRRRPGSPQAGTRPQVLVGRDALIAQVQALLAHDTAVLLVGEGAVGKTALLDAIVAADGRRTHRSGGLATMGWRDQWVIRDAARLPWDEGDADDVAGRVEAVVGPDLLVLDDLHLADSGSRRISGLLAGRIAILAAARPESDAVEELVSMGFVRIDVPLLPDEAMAALVTRLRPETTASDVADIVARSGGLPLLAEFLCQGEPGMAIGRGLTPRVDALSGDLARTALLLALADRSVPPTASTTALVAEGIARDDEDGVRIRHALVAEGVLARASADDLAHARRDLADLARSHGDIAAAARYRFAAGDASAAESLALDATADATTQGERALLLLLAAQAAWSSGRADHVVPALQALSLAAQHQAIIDLTDDCPATTQEASAVYALTRARAHWHLGDADSAVREARDGIAAAASAGPQWEAPLLREVVRCELLSIGPQPDHDELLVRARGITPSPGPGTSAQFAVDGIHAYFRGEDAAVLWEEGRIAAEAEGDLDSLLRCSNNLISWHESAGDRSHALALAEEMADVASRHRLGEWRAQFIAMAANLHWHLAEYPKAMAALDTIDAMAVDAQTRSQAMATRIACLIDLGVLDEAERLLAAPHTAVPGDWLRDAAYLRAALAYWSGDPRRALEAAQPLIDTQRDPSMVWFPRALVAWSQHDLGEVVDVPLHGRALPVVEGLVREVKALHLLAEDPGAAVAAFDEAAAVGRNWSRSASVRAEFGAAEAARLAGATDAVDRLLAVESLCVEIGLEPLLAKVHRSLRLCGVRRAARRAPDRSGLMTERERLVLELSAKGATYEEIARRLGVGRSTVRRLLDSARSRLGAPGKFAAVAALPVD